VCVCVNVSAHTCAHLYIELIVRVRDEITCLCVNVYT